MKAFRFWSKAVLFLLLSFSLLACAVSNSPVTKTGAYPKVLERARKEHRPMVMHSGVDTFSVTSVVVERSKRQFTVHLGKLDSVYQATLTAPSPAKKAVHLFMRDSTSYTLDEPHTIPLNRIGRIELAD
jgi:hypothetical protein